VPEGESKLARNILLVGTALVPGAVSFGRKHWFIAAMGGESLVIVTAFIAKVWDKLETQYVDAVAKWTDPKLQSLLTRYRARYRRAIYFQHRTFDVKGLNTQGAYSLELGQVFVELALSAEAPHKIPIHLLRKPELAAPPAANDRRDIWAFLKNEHSRHLAILGAPGSGKTTLLKHIALALAGPKRKRPLALTPVLLYLRDLQAVIPQITLANAIRQSLPKRFEAPTGWVENELENQRCLILLDGLDEVADTDARRKVASWVEARMKEFSDTRFVVTSRPNGYLSNPIDGVTVLDVKPFTWPQVERFAKNWYLATETVRAGKRDTGVEMQAETGAQDLLTRLAANPALTDLAVNPLLLTMITTVHKERNSLPGRRVELYQEICDVFLGKRRASKGLPLDLTPAQKKRVLQPLAWHMMEQNLRVIGIPTAEAQIAPVLALVDPNVKPADFFTSVRDDSGLMIEPEKDEYAFAHLTFQEYLASVHARTERLEPVLVQHVDSAWWAETIRLYAAQNNATRIVEACIASEVPSVDSMALAMDCRDEGLEVTPETRSRVEEIVVAGLESKDYRRRKMAAEVQLVRYIQSMVRVEEDRYQSRELVSNALFELFVREAPYDLAPKHWPNGRFPSGDGGKAVYGVSGSAASQFCDWLSHRYPAWRFELPAVCLDSRIGPHWRKDPAGFRCCYLPNDWDVLAQERLAERLARKDYTDRVIRALESALAVDFAFARVPYLERDRTVVRALDSARDAPLDFRRDLDVNHAFALALEFVGDDALARNDALDRALARALYFEVVNASARDLAAIETLSLLLSGTSKPKTASAIRFADSFLAAALALEQQAGRIPPHPAGIALVRRKVK
jgi:energy-coupling factor transporter ATP-binding protein EcfA2